MEFDKVVRTSCPRDCGDSCAILAYVKDGKLVRLTGDPEHPITKGQVCAKMEAFHQWVYHPDRLKSPLKRVGERGENKWAEITWEEALDLTARNIRETIEKHGPEAIFYLWGTGTHANLYYRMLPHRFFNALGGATNIIGTLCIVAGHKGVEFAFGQSAAHDPEDIINAKTIVEWGKDIGACNMHFMPLISRAVNENGAELVSVNPRLTELGAKAHLVIRPYPGTDGALALGMMNVIIEERLYDAEFVSRYTVGFDRLTERVREYPLEKVARITGVPASRIREFATKYAVHKPSSILLGMGLQHHTNGAHMFHAIACLAAITGNVGIPGGGINPTNRLGSDSVNDFSLRLDGMNKHKKTIPIVRFAESILTQKPHPVKLLFVWASNPVAQNPDTNKTIRAFKSGNLDFIVVIDPFMTDTAKYADLVLPGCSYLEQTDVGPSYWHFYMQMQQKVIDPLPGVKTDFEIFRELATRLGIGEYFNKSEEEYAIMSIKKGVPATEGISLEKLKSGRFRLGLPEVTYSDRKFPTPSGKVELYSEKKKSLGFDPLPIHLELEEGPDKTPELFKKYPLNFISYHSKMSMHSMDYKTPLIREIQPEPLLEINPVDAVARSIQNGDAVMVHNDRGSVKLKAKVSKVVRAGVVAMEQGWSLDKGCANLLTSDRLTDLGYGSTYFTCLVQVSKTGLQTEEL